MICGYVYTLSFLNTSGMIFIIITLDNNITIKLNYYLQI